MSVSSRRSVSARWLLAAAFATLLGAHVQAIEPPATNVGLLAEIEYGSLAVSDTPLTVIYPLSLAVNIRFCSLAQLEMTFEVASLDSELALPRAILTVGYEHGMSLAAGRSEVRSGYGSIFSANQLALPVAVDSAWEEPEPETVPQDLLRLTWANECGLVQAILIPSFREAPPPDAASAWVIHQGIPSVFVFPYPAGTPRLLRDVTILDARTPADTLNDVTALLRAQFVIGPASAYVLGYRGRTRDFQVRSKYEYPITPYVFDYGLEPVSASALLVGGGVQLRFGGVRTWIEANYGRRDRLVETGALVASGGDTAIVRFQELVPVVTTAVSAGIAVDAWVLHGEADVSYELEPQAAKVTTFPSFARVLSAEVSADIPTAIGPDGVTPSLGVVASLLHGLTTVRAMLSVALTEGARASVGIVLPLSPFGLFDTPLARYGRVLAGLQFSAGP